MADTGHVAIRGFKAGAIKYTVLRGYVPNPTGVTLNACVASRGFGLANSHKPALRGFKSNTLTPSSAGGFSIFGGAVIS